MRTPRHGTTVPRGDFGSLFPDLPACAAGPAALADLAALMEGRSRQLTPNLGVPAGFTYLGQFVDHDLTFDLTSSLEVPIAPGRLENARTPRFDLDSLYGAGPVAQPYLYDHDGPRLLAGDEDLARNAQGRALIGDPRNDENALVAQLHLLFLRFHNAVAGAMPDAPLAEVQLAVRRHYQWLVVHELLPGLAGEAATRGALARRSAFPPAGAPFIPVEFSAAAYRCGHSMVRDAYGLRRPPPVSQPPGRPIFPDLAGLRPLAPDLVVEWERFFRLPGAAKLAQPSLRIDTALAPPLFRLPEGEPRLALRNLLRGRVLGLPSGQDVAAALRVPALQEEELRIDDAVPARSRRTLRRSTPLWYYVLAEAERERRHLGPVGGRIVTEVMVGLLRADPASYLHARPAFRPWLGRRRGAFGMADVVLVARGDRAPGERPRPRAARRRR